MTEKTIYQKYADMSIVDEKNFGAKYTPDEIDTKFISKDELLVFYSDTLTYLHLYNSLYLALFKYTTNNDNDISKFTTLIDNLSITLDDTTQKSDVNTTPFTVGTLSRNHVFTFYNLANSYKYNSLTNGNLSSGTIAAREAVAAVSPIPSSWANPTLVFTDNTYYYSSGSPDTYTLINTKEEYTNKVNINTTIYKKAQDTYTVIGTFPTTGSGPWYITTSSIESGVKPDASSTAYTTVESLKIALLPYISSTTPVYTRIANKAGYDTIILNASVSLLYVNIGTTSTPYIDASGHAKADIYDYMKSRVFIKTEGSYSSFTPLWTQGTFVPATAGSAAVAAIVGNIIAFSPDSHSHYNEYVTDSAKLDLKYTNFLPCLLNTNALKSTGDFTRSRIPDSSATIYKAHTKSSVNAAGFLTPAVLNGDSSYNNNEVRREILKSVLKEILNTPKETIMGYLLYKKLYYNYIIYNLDIQYIIRENYLYNSVTITNANFKLDNFFTSSSVASAAGTGIVTTVRTLIDNMKTNVSNLITNTFKYDINDFIKDKFEYASKIEKLRDIKENYEKIQNSLNIAVKEYNKHLKNFTNIKQYASYIVIFLIILIIATILITILPTITPEIKSTYYVITFIILSIVTYFFNNRFNHVNLYEKFTMNGINGLTIINYRGGGTSNKEQKNHYDFCNSIITNINNYNDEVKNLTNEIRNNINTVGNKTFSKDANSYLYKLYLEKKNQNEVNRLKKVSLTNFIESMKKQVLYLFNIIVFISNLIIILLLGLMLYSGVPFLLPYIIALCVILTVILVVYFMIAIIQPTRMIASKNYWANNRPDADLLNNL